jgi:hypothetical protein
LHSCLASTPQTPSIPDTELETRVDVIVKNPEIILLEDQHNSNANCLVLDVRSLLKQKDKEFFLLSFS